MASPALFFNRLILSFSISNGVSLQKQRRGRLWFLWGFREVFLWQFLRVPLPPFYSNHWSSPLKLPQVLSRTEYLSVPAAWGQHAELSEALVFCCVPCSETNFLQQGSLFRWRWYTAHEADQVSIINRRLKQLYGTLKHPLLPALTYGPGLQAALDHLNYCNNQPSPAGAHYHNARRRYRESADNLALKIDSARNKAHMKYILTSG